MKSEDTILNQQQNDNEETLLNNGQSPQKEQPAKKSNSWKSVTIGGISGILLGGASTFFTSSSSAANDSDAPSHGSQSTTSHEATPISPDSPISVEGLPIATVSDDMSFSEAFAAARQEVGPGGVFEWHGGVYGTYYANEWNDMTPEQRADFGNHISYGTSGAAHETAENITEGNHTTAEHHEVVADATTEEPEIVNVEHENAHIEDEVQIVGISDETMDDGSMVTIGQLEIDGHEVYVVDVDHNGTFDIMGVDMNGDGIVSEDEVYDIQDQGLQVSDMQQQMDAIPSDDYLADMPDYINDADPSGFA